MSTLSGRSPSPVRRRAKPRVRGAQLRKERCGGRLWFYTNYHCNLACRYCLTSSSPRAPRRELDAATIVALADEAVELGFETFGVTGGEPFMRSDMPALLGELARRLPVIVLTNGTLFTPRGVKRLARLAGLAVTFQVSLDSAEPRVNDGLRGEGTHAAAVAGIRSLREAGFMVRIGTTIEGGESADLQRLCELHLALGIGEPDHVVRPVIRRGRADEERLGVTVERPDVPAELTITRDGAFWSPASPTVTGGRLDDDELLTRTIMPLRVPVDAMHRVADSAEPATGKVA